MKALTTLLAALALASVLRAAPTVEQSAAALKVNLDNGVTLNFALVDGYLLGLNTAVASGVALKSPDTVVRPVLAEEFVPDRRIWDILKLKEAKVVGDAVEITAELLGSTGDDAFKSFFVFTGDRGRTLKEGMTPELKVLEAKARAAESAMEPFLPLHERYAKWLADQQKDQAKIDAGNPAAEKIRKGMDVRAKRMADFKTEALEDVAGRSTDAAKAHAPISEFNKAVDLASLNFAKIHRDFYEFAINRLPSEICTIPYLKAQIAKRAATAKPGGTLTWRLKPESRTVAGWPYKGWSSQYEFSLADGRKVNNVRQVGTWEIGGKAVGATLVSARYRGIGGIEHTVADNGGKSKATFTTTEIMPGAAGKGPVISPAAPDASGKDFTDPGYALKHRTGAWIAQPARGAGSAFVDFQYRPEAILASSFDRMDNLRAVTEIFPGDATVSQTDSWWFANTSSAKTEPQIFLTLIPEKAFAKNESRTRWQELDQHFRERVATELGYVLFEPRPAVGMNIDNSWSKNIQSIADRIPGWADMGIKDVYVHHPGWQNGREKEPGQTMGAGDCAINDWLPLSNTAEPWKNVTRAAAQHGLAYHVWLTGMNFKGAPFFEAVGGEKKNWAFNRPDATEPSGYPPNLWNFNIHSPQFMKVFLDRMDKVRNDYGYQGIWYDSFQNLFNSTLDWANGTGAPMSRPWWEQIAKWSREGIVMTSESHGFPGLSCSIEVDNALDDAWWFMPFTARWYRTDFPNPGTPHADEFTFRMMANKAWPSPQVGNGKKPEESIPSISRLAKEYNAALPAMRRSFILPEMGGVLWLGFKDNKEGVWFPFSNQPVPAGVKAATILDNAAANSVEASKTYKVSGDDLLAAFKVRTGPEKDERLGKSWEQPKYSYPGWAK